MKQSHGILILLRSLVHLLSTSVCVSYCQLYMHLSHSHCFPTLHILPWSYLLTTIDWSNIHPRTVVANYIWMVVWLVQFAQSPDLTEYLLVTAFPNNSIVKLGIVISYSMEKHFTHYCTCTNMGSYDRIIHLHIYYPM